jgi:hypothetical protein
MMVMPLFGPRGPGTFQKQKSNEELDERVTGEANAVAAVAQVHSSSRTSSGFKYGRKSSCRFEIPWELIPQS